jgi:hypothetical protein
MKTSLSTDYVKKKWDVCAPWFTDVANYGQEEECVSCVTLTLIMLM